jgi:hypothetical protein
VPRISKRLRFMVTKEKKEKKPKKVPYTVWLEEYTRDRLEEVAIETGIPPAIVARALIEQGLKNEVFKNNALWAGVVEKKITSNIEGERSPGRPCAGCRRKISGELRFCPYCGTENKRYAKVKE